MFPCRNARLLARRRVVPLMIHVRIPLGTAAVLAAAQSPVVRCGPASDVGQVVAIIVPNGVGR